MTDKNNDQQKQQASPSVDRRGKLIFLVVVIIVAVVIYLRIQRKGGELPDWPDDLNGAFIQAKAEGRPVLLLLTDIPPSLDSRNLGSVSIAKSELAIKEGKFITRLVQGTTSKPAMQYEVKEFPTLIIFAPDGREFGRNSGYLGLQEFRDFLKIASKPTESNS